VHESSHEKIVLFDFDRTITRRDTVISFVVRCGRLRRLLKLSLKAILNNPRPIFARDRDFIKESVVTAALADLTQDVLLQAAELHAQAIVERGLRRSTLKAINGHILRGHSVVIVSASFEIYLNAVAPRIGASHVIASKLEVKNARLTGRLSSKNCRSAEKVIRVNQWLATRPKTEIIAAYGNSLDDLPLLGLAGNRYFVTRRRIKPIDLGVSV
jgi:phosphatidylglycerophosphatase C